MTSILAILAGAGFGLVYLGVLWAAVRSLTAGHGVRPFLALALARALLLGGALWLALAAGATAAQIGLALAGFVAVRLAATRRARAARPEHVSWK